MKVYLAGPIRGNPDFVALFKKHEQMLNRLGGYEIFNPAEKEAETGGDETLEFRRKVFALDTAWICNEADAIALIPGWEHSSGARAEHALAIAIGLQVMYL